jgi:hypothetical protein
MSKQLSVANTVRSTKCGVIGQLEQLVAIVGRANMNGVNMRSEQSERSNQTIERSFSVAIESAGAKRRVCASTRGAKQRAKQR